MRPGSHRRAMNGGFLRFSGRTSPTEAGILEPPSPSLSLNIRSNVLKVKGNVALPILANAL